MLGVLRRCTASIPRSIASVTSSSRISGFHPFPSSTHIARVSRTRTFYRSSKWLQEAATHESQTETDEQEYTDRFQGPLTKFQDLSMTGIIHPNVIDTITKSMKLETMTEVQSATVTAAVEGTDIVAQARTGTGKTIAFLLPTLQRILQVDPDLADRTRGNRTQASDIRAIIISPTRELAEQIAQEARKICEKTNVIVQCAVGGTERRMMLQRTQREGCHILIGTPGRIRDIMADPYSGVAAPKLDCFVLDEADRLLDAGFWPEIEDIQTFLPPRNQKDRQTLMFSATIPREVIHLVRSTLKRGFQFVKCIQDNEAPTVDRVPQKLVKVVGLENYLPTLYELVRREIENPNPAIPFKAIAFFPSTAEVSLAADVFRNLSGADGKNPLHPVKTIEIHGKLTQGQRTKAAENFKRSASAMLFSSDVTARGMDFPGVTHVIQVGQPQNRDTYIHRIGRTARAGKEGQAWMILTELELQSAKARLRSLPITNDETLHAAKVDMSAPAQVPAHIASILTNLGQAHKRVDPQLLDAAYVALFGIFGWIDRKAELVAAMNRLARYGWGMEKPPAISPSLANRMRISNIQGVNIHASDFGGGSSRGGFGNRAGLSRGGFGDRRSSSQGGFGGDRGDSRGGSRGGYRGRNDRGYGGRNRER